MNKNIKELIKLLYIKLNEDLLSDLEDDDDEDDSDFINYDENIVNSYSKPDASFMNNYNNIGDLLTYKNNLFFIIKNNKSIIKIGENLNTEYYGKVICMCVGKGLWLSTEFDYTKAYIWAKGGTKLYKKIFGTTIDDGWYNTTYIWNNYSNDLKDTVWLTLYEQEITGLGKHICYLPSVNQLEDMYKNNNIIKLDNLYWSSSQCPYNYNSYDAYNVYFGGGSVCNDNKANKCSGLALLHFE